MKLNESVVAQKTGYKNAHTSMDILDWVCIGCLIVFASKVQEVILLQLWRSTWISVTFFPS